MVLFKWYYRQMSQRLKFAILILLVLALIAIYSWRHWQRPVDVAGISNFTECAAAGYPIMETYPEQCRTPDGRNFVQEITSPVVPQNGGSGDETNVTSGIAGIVLLGPTCPVVQAPPDPQCADRPFATSLVLTSMDGSQIVKEFSSDAQGKFQISAPPGNYLVRSAPGGPVMPSCFKNEEIEVTANSYTQTIVYCDSGIR
jgi:hypothetical protein